MEKLNIIVETDNTGENLVGWLRNKPAVISEAKTFPALVENLINAHKTIKEVENDLKKEKK